MCTVGTVVACVLEVLMLFACLFDNLLALCCLLGRKCAALRQTDREKYGACLVFVALLIWAFDPLMPWGLGE